MSNEWSVLEVGNVTALVTRGRAPRYDDDAPVMVVGQKCVRNGIVSLELARRTNVAERPIAADLYLCPGDVLINSTGRGTLGRVGFFEGADMACTVDSHVTIVRANPEIILPRFLSSILHARETEIENYASGSTSQTELSRDSIRALKIPVPSIEEQRRVIDLLDSLGHVARTADEQARSARELRSAVLSSIVTSKHLIPSAYDAFFEDVG